MIARAFFDAITKPLSTTSSGRAPAFFFEAPRPAPDAADGV